MKTKLNRIFSIFSHDKKEEQRTKTQEEVVLDYLKKGNTLSQLEATRKFNYIRLSAIVHSLNRKGHRISCEIIYPKTGTKYGLYKLEE